jgi:predicted GNAT family acetyltransferase
MSKSRLMHVRFTEDAVEALALGRAFLTSRPVLQTLLLTLLEERVRRPEAGRYWIADGRNGAVGLAMQSPLTYPALLSAMPEAAVRAIVESMHEGGFAIPGITGDARTAAFFAADWAAATKSPTTVTRAMRLYEARAVKDGAAIAGRFRAAAAEDQLVLAEWVRAFMTEVGDKSTVDVDALVEHRIANGNVWLWDDEGPVSMASISVPAAGVARVTLVYTPAGRRGRGYAYACVAALTKRALAGGIRCALFADLENPVSNGVYRRIGYRRVAEMLTFGFK